MLKYLFIRFDVEAAAAVHAAGAPLRPAPADLLLPALHLQVTSVPSPEIVTVTWHVQVRPLGDVQVTTFVTNVYNSFIVA